MAAFLEAVDNEARKRDAHTLNAMMERITGEKGVMWGPSIVGFDTYHYKYASGREGDWMITGFSPRKAALSVYIMPGFSEYAALMAKLGKHKTGKSCLYINKLPDIDLDVLEEIVTKSVAWMRQKYGK
ncbi:MAG: DUF1801 domain-containing protein [Hyphomicrobiales bacterium]|nr:DUF1801 domain-containing protein [Hyphomicrobiales bacterium]